MMRDIVITIPRTTNWETYLEEIALSASGGFDMNFKVSAFPKESGAGCKCYICYKGVVVGYMIIKEFVEKSFTCTTTGIEYNGNFIVRSGKFYPLEEVKEMKGFQGFRYYN